ncbi:urea transporter [Kitasatospora sp. NPDC048722]|uniref:urea transporter n=1 Tax=Kitasatospora sp. NPDC048722 TaxID=3155639 RepID=UPI0033FBF119
MGQEKDGPAAREATHPISVRLVIEVLRGMAQVDLLPSAVCGLIFTAALLAAGWRYGAYGLLGSAVGTGTAYALQLAPGAVGEGLLGYNGVLVTMALCGVFVAPGAWSAAYALSGAVAATVLTPALDAVAAPFGSHAFTWPFVVTTVLFLAAVPAVPRLRRV